MNRLVLLMIVAALLHACGQARPTQPATPVPLATVIPSEQSIIPPINQASTAELTAQLDKAEQQWQNAQIASYRITMLEIHSIWSARRMTFTITDGYVVDQQSMCIPAPMEGRTCTIQLVESSKYLIPAMFQQARDLVAEKRPETIRLVFDPALGYLQSIGYDDPQIADEDYGLRIEQFEQLAGRSTSQLGQDSTLKIGEIIQVEGLSVTVVRIVEDSRCPASVNCAWAGQVVIEVLIRALNQQDQTIQLSSIGAGMNVAAPTQVGEQWQLQLINVTPYPETPDEIPIGAYQVILRMSK